ncbi:hypothetical protein [Brevundimonas sp.]|uniref:hypothetical protein n=1 Tax=Brevundimonas sp. TaxID=1871086 RepID=UPI003565092A
MTASSAWLDEDDFYDAEFLEMDVIAALRRYREHYGHLASSADWRHAPWNPEIKLALLVDNVFSRAMQSRNTGWRIKLDRSAGGPVSGLILSKQGQAAVLKIELSCELIRMWTGDRVELPPLFFDQGGQPIIRQVAVLCADFFGDSDGIMPKVD